MNTEPTPLKINEFANRVHALAWQKGWHDPDESEDHFIERACNNLHDEVSELHEAWRNNKLRAPCDKAEKMKALEIEPLTCVEEEYADIIIRAFDNCRRLQIDVEKILNAKHAYNRTRPERHGGKRS